jgi:hypothetical protein
MMSKEKIIRGIMLDTMIDAALAVFLETEKGRGHLKS